MNLNVGLLGSDTDFNGHISQIEFAFLDVLDNLDLDGVNCVDLEVLSDIFAHSDSVILEFIQEFALEVSVFYFDVDEF